MLQSLSDCKEREANYRAEQSQLERDISVYKDGISAHRSRMRDMQTAHQIRMRELASTSNNSSTLPSDGRRISDLTEACEKLSSEIAEAERSAEKELADISLGHKVELQKLDAQVQNIILFCQSLLIYIFRNEIQYFSVEYS